MFGRSIAAIGALLLLSPLTALAHANGTLVTVPGGTPITIHLTSEMSSSSAHQGDKFSFSVLEDVRTRGWVAIPAGSRGVGEVTAVEIAGGNGHSGKLNLRFDYVYAIDGEKVRVTQTANATEGEQKKGAASTATIATYALLGPVGLFAHNWVKGREASISPKTSFSVFVDKTVHVEAVDHTGKSGDDDFAH
jgi:hypothetical protein